METPSWWYRWNRSVSTGHMPWTRLAESLDLARVRMHQQGKSLPGNNLNWEDLLHDSRYNLW